MESRNVLTQRVRRLRDAIREYLAPQKKSEIEAFLRRMLMWRQIDQAAIETDALFCSQQSVVMDGLLEWSVEALDREATMLIQAVKDHAASWNKNPTAADLVLQALLNPRARAAA